MRSLVHRLPFPSRRPIAPEKPLCEELSSTEQLEERAKALAARFTLDPAPRRGVAGAELDGAPVDPGAIPLVDDGATHTVQVVLGDAEQSR